MLIVSAENCPNHAIDSWKCFTFCSRRPRSVREKNLVQISKISLGSCLSETKSWCWRTSKTHRNPPDSRVTWPKISPWPFRNLPFRYFPSYIQLLSSACRFVTSSNCFSKISGTGSRIYANSIYWFIKRSRVWGTGLVTGNFHDRTTFNTGNEQSWLELWES